MNRYEKFEPLFGDWHVEGVILSSDRETVLRASREKDGVREYCAIKHIPIPTDEETLEALISGGMDEATIDAYVDDRLRDANREMAIAERLKGHRELVEYEDTAAVPREGKKGCDLFIRMKLYESLEDCAKKQAFSREEAAKLARDIAAALEVFSAQGIVHRNVTPENIFVGPDCYKLGGYSQARIMGTKDDDYPDAAARIYAAPELLKGESRSEATDVYSLGMILYRLTNRGRLPFLPQAPEPCTEAMTESAVLKRIAGAKLPMPADSGEDLGSVILTACASDPADRFKTAKALTNALSNLGKPAPQPELPADEPVFEPTPLPQPAPELPKKGPARKKAKKQKKKAEEEPAWIPEETEPARSGGDGKGKNKGLKAAIIVFAIIAGLALLGIAGYFIKNEIDAYRAEQEANAFKPRPPEIVQDAEDPDLYYITVYAENGSAVVYENLDGIRRQYQVNEDNRITFEVRGTDLIPNEPIDSTAYSVQPKFYTRNEAGELVPISDMGFIMLEVPSLNVTFESEDEITTDDGSVKIKGRVEDKGVKLEANGEAVTLASDGSFTYQTNIGEDGVYDIEFIARKARCATFRKTFRVSVAIPEAPVIQMPWDYGDTAFSQRVADPNDTVHVYGRVPEGAMLLAEPESELVTIEQIAVSDDGTFAFDAVIAEIGDYTIKLQCTDPSGIASERRIHVQRAPEWRTYVEGAWAMNYDALTRPGAHAYNVKGTVTGVTEHIEYYLVTLETSDGNTLVLEYHYHYPGANSFEIGREYKWIYGYPKGRNADGAPVVYVWFVNDRG